MKLRLQYKGFHVFAQTLVWLLNQPPNDLPNAMMTRWLTYIRLFDFTVKHVPGNKNGGADALSRRGYADGDGEEDDTVDDYFDAKLYSIQASSAPRDLQRESISKQVSMTARILTSGNISKHWSGPPTWRMTNFGNFGKRRTCTLFAMGTSTNGPRSVEYPLGE